MRPSRHPVLCSHAVRRHVIGTGRKPRELPSGPISLSRYTPGALTDLQARLSALVAQDQILQALHRHPQ